MQKGEYIISLALAAVVLLTVLALRQQWGPRTFKEMASTAEEFILTTTGIRGQVPDISGYERVATFPLGRYRAALYRASPAPLVFAPGQFVIYSRDNQAVFRIETLEGSKEAWTTLYNFADRQGRTLPGSRARPVYTRVLSGAGEPCILVGQYSGGNDCCTIATVLELGKESVRLLGRIDRMRGLPFEGLEILRLDEDPAWELAAHRAYVTSCTPSRDAADVLAVYDYVDGQYVDRTPRFTTFLEAVLRQNLSRWSREKARSLALLQTLAANFAQLGQRDQARRFFAMNLGPFLPELQRRRIDPNACIEDLERLVERLAGGIR